MKNGHGVGKRSAALLWHCYCSTNTTVTDLGSSLKVSFPLSALAEMDLGTTLLGASKVLMLFTFGAVSISPAADLAATPLMFSSISTARLGSTLVTSSQSF